MNGPLLKRLTVLLSVDRPLDSADSPIDMAVGARLQPLGKRVVFIVADVLAGFSQKFQRLVQTAGMIGQFINRRMVFRIFTVFNRCLFDLIDRRIDPADRFDLILSLRPIAGAMFDHPPGRTQIGKRMQVIRMGTKGIHAARGAGPGCPGKYEKQGRKYAEETLDLELHFHEKEILSKKMIPVV
jgi:hypothetical protein